MIRAVGVDYASSVGGELHCVVYKRKCCARSNVPSSVCHPYLLFENGGNNGCILTHAWGCRKGVCGYCACCLGLFDCYEEGFSVGVGSVSYVEQAFTYSAAAHVFY